MKQLIKLYIVCVLLITIGCDEYTHDPILIKSNKPSKVKNIELTPINGGFNITYTPPKDDDLLYVKAVYTNSKGELSEAKSSIFGNEIKILGFGDTEEKTISLYAVNRSENISEPTTVKGSPLTPPVFVIADGLKITEDWGGARFAWENPTKTPVSIRLLTPDLQGKLDTIDNSSIIYTEALMGKSFTRGYTEPTLFAAVIRDRFDNFSDTIYPRTTDSLIIPKPEQRLDKTKFRKVILGNDDNWDAWEGDYWHLIDDDLESIVHTQGTHPRPSILTIDLGVNVEISRFTVYQRQNRGFAFSHGNPKVYTVYGSKVIPGQDGNLDDWIKLKECTSVKPSGLPLGQNTDEDFTHFENGDTFSFEADEVVEIRYFRFSVEKTWDGAGFVDFAEMTFWGNVISTIEE